MKVLLFVLAMAAGTAAHAFTGVILMHGKWDTPPGWQSALGRTLEAAGMRVVFPEMPWSGQRLYDATYEDAMRQIEAEVGKLRGAGATRILVGGHSFGANATIGYGAWKGDVDGLIVLAAGHVPEGMSFRKVLGASTEKANAMMADGRGDEKASFEDFSQGKRRSIHTTARIYLSHFDPEGPAPMSLNAEKFRKPLPVLFIMGERDTLSRHARSLVYDRLPPHPGSRYSLIASDHLRTPGDAQAQVLQWIQEMSK